MAFSYVKIEAAQDTIENKSVCGTSVSVGGGLTLVSLFQSSYPQNLALCFLEEVRKAFREEIKREHGATASQSYDSIIETASRPYQYIRFERVIQRKRTQFKDPRSHDSLKRLNQNLTEITSIMQKNINDLILRGENLEDVNKRAEDLRDTSRVFAKMAHKMSLRAWMETYLPFITLGIVCLLIMFFVLYPIW